MELHIKNIAKIEKADIEINGITVIAGENNTGKSTIGKVLYCLYTAFHDLNGKIFTERYNSVVKTLFSNYQFPEDPDDLSVRFATVTSLAKEIMSSGIDELESILSKGDMALDDALIKRIKNALDIGEQELVSLIIKRVFSKEFHDQVESLYNIEDVSEIELVLQGTRSILNITEGYQVENIINLNHKCIVIDNPFIVDDMVDDPRRIWPIYGLTAESITHEEWLIKKLRMNLNENDYEDLIEQHYMEERLGKFKDYIIDIIGGDIAKSDDEFVFHDNKLDKDLKLKNLSAGMKTFTILLKLLENGDIQDGSIIVLDEPEIHLHPSWQLKFAELLVLLQKEFNLNIVLATHSPYFMNALQVYSAKHEIADKTKYYLAELNEEGRAVFDDVTLDPERVYKLLAQPFQILADEEEQE